MLGYADMTVYDEILFDVRAHYRACKRTAATAGLQHGWIYDLDHATPSQTLQMQAHGLDRIAALYGCSPSTVAALQIMGADGYPRPGVIETVRGDRPASIPPGGERVPDHHLTLGWWEAHATCRLTDDLQVMNRELRGVSRALWLATLWAGHNPAPLRARWYAPSDLGAYWPAAWMVSREGYGPILVAYGRALVWRYAEIHRARYPALQHKAHAAHAVIEAAAALWIERAAA